MPTPRRSLTALLIAMSITAAACASSDSSSSNTSPPTAEASQEFNANDVMFAQGMIPHHSQAVEMASLALTSDRGASDEVRDLARRIESAQDPEIEQMTEWLISWDQPLDMPAMDGMEMDGMVASDELDALAKLEGTQFEAEWTRLMIAHHEGAIAMAEAEIESGLNEDAIALAENIVTTQQTEVDELRS